MPAHVDGTERSNEREVRVIEDTSGGRDAQEGIVEIAGSPRVTARLRGFVYGKDTAIVTGDTDPPGAHVSGEAKAGRARSNGTAARRGSRLKTVALVWRRDERFALMPHAPVGGVALRIETRHGSAWP